jgi:hypothetical protein
MISERVWLAPGRSDGLMRSPPPSALLALAREPCLDAVPAAPRIRMATQPASSPPRTLTQAVAVPHSFPLTLLSLRVGGTREPAPDSLRPILDARAVRLCTVPT